MQCPKCQNEGFAPTKRARRALVNLGKKEYFKTFITRYYACVNCGHRFQTKEEHYRPVEPRENAEGA